jgi:hypothetical protein
VVKEEKVPLTVPVPGKSGAENVPLRKPEARVSTRITDVDTPSTVAWSGPRIVTSARPASPKVNVPNSLAFAPGKASRDPRRS